MRTVEFARYYLPSRIPGRAAKLSRWHMTAAEAAALGALERDDASVITREVPETEEEVGRAMAFYQSAGHDGTRPPRK